LTPKDMPGRKIVNRYQILEKLGGGGMSVVWKAYDHVLGRNVALKILRPEMSEDEDFVRRFRREAKSAASLSHPNIVNIYDVGEDHGLYFIVMELIEGETLRDKLKREGRLSVSRALNIAAQICEGLAHAHAHRIIHRDIKPQNILITKQEHVKVADFGIARALGGVSTTSTNVVVGSAPYLSPEQVRSGVVSARSDLYSLGVVIYEMLTGDVPFEGENPVAIALQHLEAKVPSAREKNPKIPRAVDALVRKAMSKKPEERFQSAEDMLRAINLIQSSKNVDSEQVLSSWGDDSLARGRKRRKPVSLSVKIFLGFMFLALVLTAYAVYLFNKWMAVPIIEVPNVVGKTQMEAQAILREKGFIPQISAERYDPDYPPNVVISQSPAGGEKAKQGREVYYVISKGQEYAQVPDVRGKTLREAQLDFENNGLILGNVNYVFHPSVEEDKVITQNPRAGTKVALGTRVDVEISKGPEPEITEVPQLVGLSKDEAVDVLHQHLLELGKVIQIPGNEPYGTVIAQNPATGTKVSIREKVDITISLGTEKPAHRETVTIQVPDKERPVNVKVVVIDVEGERVVYDRNEKPGEAIQISFEYRGAQVIMKTFFDGEPAGEVILRP